MTAIPSGNVINIIFAPTPILVLITALTPYPKGADKTRLCEPLPIDTTASTEVGPQLMHPR